MSGENSFDERDSSGSDGVSRREWIQMSAAGIVGATALGTEFAGTSRAAATDPGDGQPADTEVGGGIEYSSGLDSSDADETVTTQANDSQGRTPFAQLNDYLDAAASTADTRTVIWIERAAATDSDPIDITDWYTREIPQKVTIAGNRGATAGERGPKLYSGNHDYGSGTIVAQSDVRFSGVQFEGPSIENVEEPLSEDDDIYNDLTVCIRVSGSNVEIDNCEFWGFTNAGVRVGNDSDGNQTSVSPHIHHCSFHDNAMEGFGYGVVVDLGEPLIEYNYFNANRHSIAADGAVGCSYEARYNVQGPDSYNLPFEMHWKENGTNHGGTRIDIHHNTFEIIEDDGGNTEAIGIRGFPEEYCRIDSNWFYQSSKPTEPRFNGDAFTQVWDSNGDGGKDTEGGWKNLTYSNNHYGTSEPASCNVGAPRPSCTGDLLYNDDATAVDASVDSDGKASAVNFSLTNNTAYDLNVVKMTIDPADSSIDELSDHTYEEGKYKSELYIDADLQDGLTDVNNGITLPGTIDLGSDGHSDSADQWAIMDSGTTAYVSLYQFEDGGTAVDMTGKTVEITIDYFLDTTGREGTETFTLTL